MAAAKKTRRRRGQRRSGTRVYRLLSLSRYVIGGLIVAVLAVVVWAELRGPGDGTAVVLEWKAGRDASQTAAELEAAGLVSSPRLFALYLRVLRPTTTIAGGQHLVRSGLSARELVGWMQRGRGRPKRRVLIPEGWTQFQIAERLESEGVCTARAFLDQASSPALRRELSITGPSVEGYLFPATYALPVNSAPRAIVRELVGEFRQRLEVVREANSAAFEELRKKRSWGEHHILTLASMVERETANPKERRTIAGVFFNRLDDEDFKPKGRLQSDPTAGYGCLVRSSEIPSCDKFDGKRITPELLRDSANRYNTYRHAGLPPGPIANPGLASIEAVLTPAKTPYLYFVAGKDGLHVFSQTFEEHQAAIERNR